MVTETGIHSLIVDTGNGNLFSKGTVGDHYIGVYAFDTIIVRGGARVTTPGLVFYKSIILNNGLFSSFTGTQTGFNEINGDVPPEVRLALRNCALRRTVLHKRVDINKKQLQKRPQERYTAIMNIQTEKMEKKDNFLFAGSKNLFMKPFTKSDHVKAEKFIVSKKNIKREFSKNKLLPNQRQNLENSDSVTYNSIQHSTWHGNVTEIATVSNKYPAVAYASATVELERQNKQVAVKCSNGDPLYTYDILERVTSMTSPAGITKYHYDTTTGLLDKITSPEGKEFTYSYHHGQMESIGYSNGITANYAFDNNGNLTDLDYKKGGTSIKRYRYGYDKNGMRDTMIDNDGIHAYTYDPLYQIIEASSPKVQRPLEQFAYDSVGNRQSGIHNELNQLTEDDSCTYAYDADGNMTEKVSKSTGDTTHFTWDIENKLTEVRMPGMVVRYVYDALGKRVSKEVNPDAIGTGGVVTQFRYDGEDLILEMDGNDSITANYTFGPEIDNPLQMHREGRNLYYVKDGLGSVTALTDSVGSVVHEYAYSVFGEIIDESGEAVKNPFTYTGREWEPEVGLYFYRARYQVPRIGRFISEDPLGFLMGVNFYCYVKNNSINILDPYGLGDVYVISQNNSGMIVIDIIRYIPINSIVVPDDDPDTKILMGDPPNMPSKPESDIGRLIKNGGKLIGPSKPDTDCSASGSGIRG